MKFMVDNADSNRDYVLYREPFIDDDCELQKVWRTYGLNDTGDADTDAVISVHDIRRQQEGQEGSKKRKFFSLF